ncbi:MAG: PEGA domain-containing protein [Candidatus Thiodiazotropha sp. DIVDIV]
MTTLPFARISCLSILLSQLQACTGIGEVSGEMPLRIETIPSGATVYIMEKAVGKTPMEITQSQLYPTAYDVSKKDHYGNITIRKAECEDYTQRVKYQEFSKGLKIELACGEFSAKRVKTEQEQTKHTDTENRPSVKKQKIEEQTKALKYSADEASQNTSEANIKQRLIRLDSLHQENLISDEEYQSARKKILSEL